jgi:DNA-binding NtrC family response regulator
MTHKPKTVLIVGEDDRTREAFAAVLKRDYRLLRAASAEAALQMFIREEVDLLLLAIALPGISGFEALNIVRENYPLTEIVMISAPGDVVGAVDAIKRGAYHCVTSETDPVTLRTILHNAGERQDLSRQLQSLNAQIADEGDREFIVGPSPATREVIDLVTRIARLSATVLILGESGTGKELLARLVHRRSANPDGPFMPVNLAAIPRELVESTLFGHEKGSFTGAHRQQLGKFELAAGGTLFLDEIGDLRLDLQAKLLRAIQEGEIERIGGARPIRTDFRLIAATNVDLERAVKEGRFREDLYYRVNVIPLRMPALRERLEDVPDLARFFLKRYSTKFRKDVQGIADSTIASLQSYWWPGNIRELENMIERIVATTDKPWITDEDLPYDFHFAKLAASAPQTGESLFQQATNTFERNFILKSLERNAWNVTATARHLGIPLSTLKFKMDRLDVRELAKKIRGG